MVFRTKFAWNYLQKFYDGLKNGTLLYYTTVDVSNSLRFSLVVNKKVLCLAKIIMNCTHLRGFQQKSWDLLRRLHVAQADRYNKWRLIKNERHRCRFHSRLDRNAIFGRRLRYQLSACRLVQQVPLYHFTVYSLYYGWLG